MIVRESSPRDGATERVSKRASERASKRERESEARECGEEKNARVFCAFVFFFNISLARYFDFNGKFNDCWLLKFALRKNVCVGARERERASKCRKERRAEKIERVSCGGSKSARSVWHPF